MPRYFMHIYNGTGFVEDEEGRELSSLDRAREEAIKGIRSLVGAEALGGIIDLRGRIEVADAEGRVILTLPFEEAVHLRTGSLSPIPTRGGDQ